MPGRRGAQPRLRAGCAVCTWLMSTRSSVIFTTWMVPRASRRTILSPLRRVTRTPNSGVSWRAAALRVVRRNNRMVFPPTGPGSPPSVPPSGAGREAWTWARTTLGWGVPSAPIRPHPSLNAMLLCDLTIREHGSGKISLIGVFENISAARFPVVHRALWGMGRAPGLWVGRDLGLGVRGRFPWARCEGGGLLSQTPRVQRDQLDRMSPDDYPPPARDAALGRAVSKHSPAVRWALAR